MTPVEKVKAYIESNLKREKEKWETGYGKNDYLGWEAMRDNFELFVQLNCDPQKIRNNAEERKQRVKAILKQEERDLKRPLGGGQLSIFDDGKEI